MIFKEDLKLYELIWLHSIVLDRISKWTYEMMITIWLKL